MEGKCAVKFMKKKERRRVWAELESVEIRACTHRTALAVTAADNSATTFSNIRPPRFNSPTHPSRPATARIAERSPSTCSSSQCNSSSVSLRREPLRKSKESWECSSHPSSPKPSFHTLVFPAQQRKNALAAGWNKLRQTQPCRPTTGTSSCNIIIIFSLPDYYTHEMQSFWTALA